jgi:hypothetical protein
MISCIDVTVLVGASESLWLPLKLDEVSGRGLRNGARNDGLPNCLDCSCSELLEDKDVGAAGAVELVTI